MIEEILARALGLQVSEVAGLLGEAIDALPVGDAAAAKGQAVLARLNALAGGRTLGGALDGEPLKAIGPQDGEVERRIQAEAHRGESVRAADGTMRVVGERTKGPDGRWYEVGADGDLYPAPAGPYEPPPPPPPRP